MPSFNKGGVGRIFLLFKLLLSYGAMLMEILNVLIIPIRFPANYVGGIVPLALRVPRRFAPGIIRPSSFSSLRF